MGTVAECVGIGSALDSVLFLDRHSRVQSAWRDQQDGTAPSIRAVITAAHPAYATRTRDLPAAWHGAAIASKLASGV